MDSDYSKYTSIESAYVYRWNAADSDWVISQVQFYQYSSGQLTELLTKDFDSGEKVALSVYSYNSIGKNDIATNYYYSGTWTPSTRMVTDYDSQARIQSIRVQKRVNDLWAEDRFQQNYIYDSQNKLIRYESIYWRNNAWTLPTVSVLYYNFNGQLESIVATRPDGNIDYRIIYEYNDEGQQTQFYTQYPDGNGWSNWNLRTSQYNGCGNKISLVQYSGKGPDWIPAIKTVYYYSFNQEPYRGKRVAVCHNGHTIIVSVDALPAHLNHGDCIGECFVEKQDQRRRLNSERENVKTMPFVIYPNPATARLNIRLMDTDCPATRIELLDLSGRTLRLVNPDDQTEVILDVNNLKSGNYILRITADVVYNTVISKN